ncbi:DUF4956 domain-containing protein [Saprospiraceae bacterium]|nr:DUF4956 domain-containing protein [Saprospiraceae bacterium]
MEFLDIPLFDDDFYKMIFRFFLNIIFTTIIIRYFYYRYSKEKSYLFTYYMISIIVFFLCFTLKKYELDLGMALGLFAIFGIIRYRTNSIAINDMSYLFVVIGVSVINSLANSKMSYSEIIGGNVVIIVSIWLLEMFRLRNHEETKVVVYENIANIKPEHHGLLKEDLEDRLGIEIKRLEIGNVDLMRDLADVTIYYDKQ